MSRKSSLLALREQYELVLENMYGDDEEEFMGNEPASSSAVETPAIQQTSLQPIGSVSSDTGYEEEEEMNEIEFVVPKTEVPQSPQKANCVKCGVCHDENEECECGDDDNGNADMAKSELFKVMNYVKNIENCMKSSKKMEAWMLSKIIKAADYLCSVNGVLQYDAHKRDVQEPADDFQNDMNLVSKIGTMLTGESKTVNEEVLKRAIFNLEIIKANEQIS